MGNESIRRYIPPAGGALDWTVGEVHGCHFHVGPPFLILDDVARILGEWTICVKNLSKIRSSSVNPF